MINWNKDERNPAFHDEDLFTAVTDIGISSSSTMEVMTWYDDENRCYVAESSGEFVPPFLKFCVKFPCAAPDVDPVSYARARNLAREECEMRVTELRNFIARWSKPSSQWRQEKTP